MRSQPLRVPVQLITQVPPWSSSNTNGDSIPPRSSPSHRQRAVGVAHLSGRVVVSSPRVVAVKATMSPLRLLHLALALLLGSLLFKSPTQALPISPPPVLRLPSEKSCPVTCFVPDPVCGEDGNTYWCGNADAACSGVGVAKEGYCALGNGGGGLFPGQALLLVHITWLIVLGFSVVLGLF